MRWTLLFRLQQLDRGAESLVSGGQKSPALQEGARRPRHRRGEQHPGVTHPQHHAVRAPPRSRSPRPEWCRRSGPPSVPTSRPKPNPKSPAMTPSSRAPFQRRSRAISNSSRTARPMIFLPNGSRARFCAARLPRSGEPKSTIRPGGKNAAAAAPPRTLSKSPGRPGCAPPGAACPRASVVRYFASAPRIGAGIGCHRGVGKRRTSAAKIPRQPPPQPQGFAASREPQPMHVDDHRAHRARPTSAGFDHRAVGARGHRVDGLGGRSPAISHMLARSKSPARAAPASRRMRVRDCA